MGVAGPSLLVESTDSMMLHLCPHFVAMHARCLTACTINNHATTGIIIKVMFAHLGKV